MATYGEGDPTDNAQDFYDWLQETNVDLSGVKYAVSFPIFLPVTPFGLPGHSLQRLTWASGPLCPRGNSPGLNSF